MRPKKENRIIFDHKRDGYHFGHCLNEDHDNYYCNVKFKGDTVGKNQVMYCQECKICWLIGRNLFSSWRYETEEDWERNYEMIKDFEYIDY